MGTAFLLVALDRGAFSTGHGALGQDPDVGGPTDRTPQEAATRPEPTATGRWPKKDVEIRLSLAEALRIALENNLDIQIGRVDHGLTYHDLVIEKSIFDPFFTLGSNYAKNRRPSASFLETGTVDAIVRANPIEVADYTAGIRGLTPLGSNYTVSLNESRFDRPVATGSLFGFNPQVTAAASVVVTQPLLKGAWYTYNTGQLRIAQDSRRLSFHQLQQTATDAVYQVEVAYWELTFYLKNYESKRNALDVSLEDLTNARKRLEVGTLAPIDVTIVESQLALRRVEFNEAELGLDGARDRLLDVLNHSGKKSLKGRWEEGEPSGPYDRILVIPTSEPDGGPLLPDRQTSLQVAFERRPDYQQILLEAKAQLVRIGLTKNQTLPQIDLVGGWEQLGLANSFGDAFSSLGTGDFYGWSAGVQLEIPLGNRAPRHAHLRAQEELRKIHLQRNQVENRVVLDVDQTLRKLRSLQRKVQDLEQRVRLQEVVLEAERRKLEVGKSISYTVSTIENDLINDQAQALQAQADFQVAKAEYYRSIGTLLDRHQIEVAR